MSRLIATTRFFRGRLPHWEVEGGRYFVTVRCGDSLPQSVVARLAEIHRSLAAIEPAHVEFAQLQRQYFQTMEKYLDAGAGESPLRDPRAAKVLVDAFTGPESANVSFPHFSVMPNHWHALVVPSEGTHVDLHALIARLKGRTAREINRALGGSGSLWQREWFDRWVRDNAEWARSVDYIRRNPIKAGLADSDGTHPWTR